MAYYKHLTTFAALQSKSRLSREIEQTVRCFSTHFSFTSPSSFKSHWQFKLNSLLPPSIRDFVDRGASVCQPEYVHVCDGSEKDRVEITRLMRRQGSLKPLVKFDNCWVAHSDPIDTARVEHKSVMVSASKRDTIPLPTDGQTGKLGNWMSTKDMEIAFKSRFPGCMRGRTMYVIPFSMGPIGSKLTKIGVQLTDSPYVVASMSIMSRTGRSVIESLNSSTEFTRCLHSVGDPLPSMRKCINNWPCNPEKLLVAHMADSDQIVSFGSSYGGNSFLGKKSMGLRLAGIRAKKEGWMAEHMLIIGVTNPNGVKKYIAAAFPSSCGKHNLALMKPSLPGYKVECVGDDLAWMWFDDEGQLRAVNPENGMFSVAPGTNSRTNPIAMETLKHNTLFTNVATTSDGGVYWEGLEDEVSQEALITSWQGNKWNRGSTELAAHPNARYCVSLKDCSTMDASFADPSGVPIDAILFGGRRPDGVPLVLEALDWNHGVMLGASLKTEPTAAAQLKVKGNLVHDPFAMRPFLGYNFGQYIDNWFSFESRKPNLPRIFHVNFFRKDPGDNHYLWPGYGDNIRVLDWICRRLDTVPEAPGARKTAIGYIPELEHFNVDGLDATSTKDLPRILNVDRDFWLNETKELQNFFYTQLTYDFPSKLMHQLTALEQRIHHSPMHE